MGERNRPRRSSRAHHRPARGVAQLARSLVTAARTRRILVLDMASEAVHPYLLIDFVGTFGGVSVRLALKQGLCHFVRSAFAFKTREPYHEQH
jgi:hypothetical protein